MAGFKWFQLNSAGFIGGSAGFIGGSAGFSWFQVVPHFSKYSF